jgi:hypothetical protein
VLLLGAAGAASGKSSGRNCSGALPPGPTSLPGAVVVTTDCGLFRLGTDGSVTYEGRWKSPVPPAARAYWMDLTWYGIERGHIVIGRGTKRLWRSHDTYPGGRRVDVQGIALGRRELAFTLCRGRQYLLFVARFGGREHLVATGEWPLAFAGGRLVTWRERGKDLLLRTDRTVRFLAHAIEPQVDRKSRMVVFRSKRWLFAFDAVRVRALASLPKLGVTGVPAVEPLGKLVAVHDRRRLVVLDYDGHVLASTAVPRHRGFADAVSSSLVANEDGTAVAYTATHYGSGSHENVYVLRAGEKKARALFSESLDGLDAGGCGRGAWVAWQGPWLLYANTQQRAAVVDSSAKIPAIELGDVIAKLPGIRTDGEGSFDVEWA